ncbi:hypothetical protein BDY17DRAFT_166858 [Neohortaea acidophila]|uniref:Peroxin/Ferlin domain-containing protein n=1 Tax=Neohortaea acidophila TaxID=245834 RepID=A0A6A6PRS6_9PEZI|nr:uncharacterized protein BDY17DRAFT_166858 [Neohortaea acidophila]KAF2482810.1 hypothetical protein BDY17DRAFT_166858 [Neohortaea acidophila]
MSTPSSVLNSLRNVPTAQTILNEHHISLLDQERPAQNGDAERNYSDEPPTPATPSTPGPLTRRLTKQSMKRQWSERKYAKYQPDKYHIHEDPLPPDEDPANAPQAGEEASRIQTSMLERSRAKAKSYLKRRGTMGQRKNENDSVVDILYENQRGMFLFGIPKYSSSSLLPSDPKPWQNAQFRTSPVDIRNAQVPDPSWEWAWKSWFVDMSRDVDEEGWEYSFMFKGGYAWHGNHPWFHSFVRRRRWLRMRRRRDVHHHTKEKAHELTAEYFTIHPKTVRPASEDYSRMGTSEMARMKERRRRQDEVEVDQMDITNIASLIYVMKRASVDREKLVAVRKFTDGAGPELYYLSERMPEIMNLLVFQSSRRQLLADLLHRFDAAHERRQSLADHKHDDEEAQKQHGEASQQAENLINAVKAADEQVKRLEYWSDIKSMVHGGEILHGTSDGDWDRARWQGLRDASGKGSSFASKQAASEGAPKLHAHPEHPPTEDDESAFTAPSTQSEGGQVVAIKHPGKDSDTGHETEGYVTAAESVSEMPGKSPRSNKGKARLSNIDGVLESLEDDAAEPPSTPPRRTSRPFRSPAKQNVRIVDPVPEGLDERDGNGGGGDGS